ncbi:MAG TPA: hypothetical protein VN663_23060 [Ramlibacter sp.]|nr:hypothetical protein [Ramlibacter sp.]
MLDHPEPGLWLIRCCPRCPWVPARIVMVQVSHEPGQPDNDMRGTRSPFLAAFISGQPVAVSDVWGRRGRIITRSEYERAVAEIAAAVRENRYDPRCAPFKAVEIESLPLPFQEEADARRPSAARRRHRA